jgi:phage shock protein C
VNPRRLYRSRDRQLAGVAGGMAEYLDIDPTVVRILWIVVGVASGGLVLLAYFILALVIPQAPYATATGAQAGWATAGSPAGASAGWSTAPGASAGWTTPPAAPIWDPNPAVPAATEPRTRQRTEGRGIGAGAIVGVVLIVVGVIALADAVLPGWVSGAILGPAVVLALGAALLVSSIRRSDDDASVAAAAPAPSTAPAESAVSENLDGPVDAAQPWDVTDTQSVDPAVYGQTPAMVIDPPDEGALRA